MFVLCVVVVVWLLWFVFGLVVCFRHAGGVVFLCFVLWCGIFVLVARCDGLIVRLGGYDEDA